MASSPQLEIGSEADSLAFLYQVEGGHRLSDGRIVVANRSTYELRYYGADGVFLNATGRQGEGPGEFQYIAWTTRCSTDSVYVYDIGTRRITVFDEAGRFVRMASLMLPDNTLPYGASSCSNTGYFISAGWPRGNPESGLHRPDMPVGTMALDGTPVRLLGMFSGVDRWGTVRNGVVTGSRPPPLGRNLSLTTFGDRVYIGTADTYEVAGYGMDGQLRLLIRLAGLNLSLSQVEIDRYVDDQVQQATSDNARRSRRRYYADIEFPEELPAYSVLMADADGLLWIRDYARPGVEQTTWRVFDTNGVYVARVTLPSGFRVFEIGPDYILGSQTDELDVEYVRLYELVKP
ncbi:MAG: 6-bladed beta-propeller [Gemmatimonadales bacterium]